MIRGGRRVFDFCFNRLIILLIPARLGASPSRRSNSKCKTDGFYVNARIAMAPNAGANRLASVTASPIRSKMQESVIPA
ncbi:hypothetical protein [Burkholderia sp. TSV86]|uniref:hypothetical protein n=1 Tax=Burkholderia sp. TSV86 TaxID=1385594 RepID=UPI0012E39332|nr:hypothetical protein [Burkholderia sp. TSV86]